MSSLAPAETLDLQPGDKLVDLVLPPLYPKQHAAVFDPARYSVIEASTKVGKTVGCIVWIMHKAWAEGKPGHHYWWVAPVHLQAMIAMTRMVRMLERVDEQKRFWRSHGTDSWIQLRSGARIWFKSGEKPDLLYGEDVYGVVVDEASRFREEAFYALRTTLTATKAPMRIIGNVRGKRNWAYRLGLRARAGEAGMGYHKLTAYDAIQAGVLDDNEVADAKRLLPEHIFKELYLAEPSDDTGNPFGEDNIRSCFLTLSLNKPIVFGIDLAKYEDWTVICGLDEFGHTCWLERFQSDWQQTIRRIMDAVGDVPTLIDSTGVGDPIVEGIKRKCPNVDGFCFTQKSKQQIMEGLASAIHQRTVRFPEGWLTNELSQFEFVYTRTGVSYSAPEGVHDDGVCALALANSHLANRPADISVRVAGGTDLRRSQAPTLLSLFEDQALWDE